MEKREHKPLKDLRKAAGLTQVDVALVADVTAPRVSQVESGEGSFSVETWLRIFDAYRVPIAKLGYSIEDFLRGGSPRGGDERPAA